MEFFTFSAGISVHVWDTIDDTTDEDKGAAAGGDRESRAFFARRRDTRAAKPVIVLLHGYLETMYIFTELIDSLRDNYRVITIDIPGHGLTGSAPAGPGGAQVNTLAFSAKVLAGVLDRCGVEKAWIAGHSMGGYVAQQFMADYPDRTEGVVLLCSHPWPDSPGNAANRQAEKQRIRNDELIEVAEAAIPRMYYEENLRACDEKIRETVELCETHDPEGICATLDGLRLRPDLRPVLAEARHPVMLVHGDHDNFLPLGRVEEMKANYPKMTFFPIANAGHNAFIEQKDKVVEAIEEFIR